MDSIKKVLSQTTWQLFGKAVTSISTILILGILTRNFGESGTGMFTLVLTYLYFYILAVDFGLNGVVLPRLDKIGKSEEWKLLFGLRLILAAVLTVIASGAAIYVFGRNPELVLISLVLAPFAIFEAAIFVSCNLIFQQKLRYDLSVVAWSLGALVELGIVFSFFYFSPTLFSISVGYILGWIVTAVLSLIFVSKFISDPLPKFDFQYIKRILFISWPVSATLLLNTVYFRIDSFILSYYTNLSVVGIYNLSYQIFQSAIVVPTFIMNGFYPILIRNLRFGKTVFLRTILKSAVLMLALGLLGTAATFLLSGTIINLLTSGKGFAESPVLFNILALSFPAFFLSSLLMWVLMTVGKFKSILFIYVIGFFANLTLNLIFIPEYSFFGASYVTVISEYLILVLQIIILVRYFKEE